MLSTTDLLIGGRLQQSAQSFDSTPVTDFALISVSEIQQNGRIAKYF